MDNKEKEQQQAPINVWGIANIGCTMENPTFQTLIRDGQTQETQAEETKRNVTKEDLAGAVMACQKYFWASSSYAVLFCVCRDCFDYPDNMSMFEREIMEIDFSERPDYTCSAGTVTSTVFNNPYMKLPIDRWKQNGAKERVLILADELKSHLLGKAET